MAFLIFIFNFSHFFIIYRLFKKNNLVFLKNYYKNELLEAIFRKELIIINHTKILALAFW